MKRICVAALVGLIVLTIVPSALADKGAKRQKRVERSETAEYELGSYGVADQFPSRNCAEKHGCAVFQAQPTERFVRVDITDMTGVPPLGQVEVDGESLALFCGSSERPIRIPAGAEVTVWVFTHVMPIYACGPATGLPTQGEVVATFSNIP